MCIRDSGMAAGMAAGAIIGMTVAEKRKAMKTCVGRTRLLYTSRCV